MEGPTFCERLSSWKYTSFSCSIVQWLIGLLRARGDGITIGGDGRADSMGHCAKYGIYTCMELNWNCILDIQLITSTEVGGSYHMELAGLQKSLNHLIEWLNIVKIVTDRHRSIAKWIRENHSAILHVYDIWHVAKSGKNWSLQPN